MSCKLSELFFFIAAWDNEMMEDVVDDSTPLYTGCSPFQNKSCT